MNHSEIPNNLKTHTTTDLATDTAWQMALIEQGYYLNPKQVAAERKAVAERMVAIAKGVTWRTDLPIFAKESCDDCGVSSKETGCECLIPKMALLYTLKAEAERIGKE